MIRMLEMENVAQVTLILSISTFTPQGTVSPLPLSWETLLVGLNNLYKIKFNLYK